MSLLERLFAPQRRGATSFAYERAMGVSDDLIRTMREHSDSNDAARAVMADVWAQRRNIPFLTSVYETVEEMKVGANGNSKPSSLKK